MRTVAIAALLVSAGSSIALGEGRMLAVDSSRALFEINRATGEKTQIGSVSSNVGTPGALAYDPASQTLYLSSTSLDSLFTLNPDTGEATLVGSYGPDTNILVHGLEWDSTNNILYAGSRGNIYTVDPATGLATQIITSTSLPSFNNLVHDSLNDVMYMTSSTTDALYSLDLVNFGEPIFIGFLAGPTNPNGLAYVAEEDTIYLVCNNTDTLYTVDRVTGNTTVVGSTGTGNLLGLVWIPGPSGPTCPPCAADYDNNGGVDGGDLAAFFADFEAGESCADVDGNGGVDGGDLGFFFQVFEAGGC